MSAEEAHPARDVYTLADLRRWPDTTAGARPPLRLAVIGDPVAHSASPPMHDAALAAEGIDARYTRLHVRPDELPEALGLISQAGFLGVNVTLPHKVAALSLLDRVDRHARALGAVNTVRVETDGSLSGFNTDGPGFEQAVQAQFGVELRSLRVLILGAGGGAGRALAAQCAMTGCERLWLVNRTAEKARELAEHLRDKRISRTEINAIEWENAALAEALVDVDLVVNASSVGLKLDDPSPLTGAMISPRLRIFDTVYRPDHGATALLAAAQEAHAESVGGQSLLLHQGALAFEHWFSRPAPLELMRRALLRS